MIKILFCDSCFTYYYYVQKKFLVLLMRWWRPPKFLLREHAFIWNTDSNLLLWGISMSCSSSMSKYLDENFFFNSVLFSGAALLNRFTKSSEFEGFNDMSCYDHFLDHSTMWCYYQCYYKKPGNFCFLIRSWQERFCHNIIFNSRIYHSFEDTCNLIKIVTFNVNPKFTGVALNRFIFTMDIFCTNPARKFGLIDIT